MLCVFVNPEVIDQFLRICIELPPKQLTRIVPKIRQENWVKLMAAYNEWGFEYKKMLRTLADAKDYKSILVLAEAVLSVRTGEESGQTSRCFLSDNPFYFRDREWMHRLLPEIFPEKSDKKHLCLASWEGYHVNKPYK